MTKKKSPISLRRDFLILAVSIFLSSCTSTVVEENLLYNDIEVPFKETFVRDTVSYVRLPAGDARHILQLDESSAAVTDRERYSFSINELIQVRTGSRGDSLRITSYSAKTVRGVSLELFLPDINDYLPVAWIDSIPAFSQFEFKPSCVGRRVVYKKADGNFVSFELPYLDLEVMKPRLVSNDEHLRKLQKIDARWQLYFSNYDWTPENAAAGWREMRPIFAREWVVMMTNYAYLMTTPEYAYVLKHFKEIFGADLCDNDKQPFTAAKYLSEAERFKQAHTFRLGRTGDQVAGLGGGETLGVASWNFYGHYASYSGWEAITHEFMHCMGYSHDSNMTYASGGTGWTEFIWQLHMWLSRGRPDLPYPDRHLLDFTNPKYAPYRDNLTINATFTDDAALEKAILGFWNDGSRKLLKYLKENGTAIVNE